MKTKYFTLAMVVVLLTVAISACTPASAPTSNNSSSVAPASQGTSLDGKALMETQCSKCHDLGRVTSQSKTESEWTATVDRMINKGAVLNDAEKAAVITYLSETYK